MQEVKGPVGTQGPALGRKMPSPRKRTGTLLTERSTIMTRSMQKKKSSVPRINTGPLPNISRLLVQAIAMCQSENGLSLTELKEVLSTKGYSVSKHCPRIKKKLQALVSKGALVRMTRNNDSTFFVVRKHPENASKESESSERNLVHRQKVKVEKRNAMYIPSKAKRSGKEAANPGPKNKGNHRKAQNLSKRLNAGGKRQKRPIRKRRSVKRTEELAKKGIPAMSRSSRSRSKAALITKRGKQPSSDRSGSVSKELPSPRKRSASSSGKPKSPVEKFKRSGCSDSKLVLSAKELESPYRQEMFSSPRARSCKSENTSLAKGKRSPRREAGSPLQGPGGSAKFRGKKQRRQK